MLREIRKRIIKEKTITLLNLKIIRKEATVEFYIAEKL